MVVVVHVLSLRRIPAQSDLVKKTMKSRASDRPLEALTS